MSIYFDFIIEPSDSINETIFKQIACQIKPHWTEHSSSIEVNVLKGGLTNSLYACFLKSNGFDHSETIMFRVYGAHTETYINRNDEIETMMKMARLGLGAKFYGRFKNGICYEYLPGSTVKNFLYDENVFAQIAKAIAKFHMVDFNGFITESNRKADQIPWIFPVTWKLIEEISPDYKCSMANLTEDHLKIVETKSNISNEFKFLENYLTDYTRKHDSLIVYSHNDLNPGNIIYNKDLNTQIKFIDFDYSCLDYQAYDIGNHFVEYSGFGSDYSDYPSKEYQLKWLSIYFNELYRLINEFYANDSDKRIELNAAKLEQFYEESSLFAMVSHYGAAIWCLIQAGVSKIDFDYSAMLKVRLDQYLAFKKRFMSSSN